MNYLSVFAPILAGISLLAGLAGGNDIVYAAAGPQADVSTMPTRYIVQFKPGTSEERMLQIYQEIGAAAENSIPQIDAHVVTLPEVRAADARDLSDFSEIALIEPDYFASVEKIPDDAGFDMQWGLNKIQAPEAWETTEGSSEIIIAILDSGIDSSHSDLSSKIVAEKNFTDSNTLSDVHGHGTHVAGIAAAVTDNSVGIAGVAREASLMNVKVLGDDGFGAYSRIAEGVIWAVDNGADVINMSMCGDAGSKTLERAIDYAWDHGTVVVAAAGNSGRSAPAYPAYYKNVIAVAATDPDDKRYSFSNYGNWVDVAAPGSAVSTLPDDKYGTMRGTSMAAPFVSGLAGLALDIAVDSNKNKKTNDEVRSAIEKGCEDIGSTGIGSGRINALNTISELAGEQQPDTPSVNPKPTPAPVPSPVPEKVAFGLDSGDSDWDQRAGVLNVMRFRNTAGNGILTRLELLMNDSTPSGKVRLMVYADNKGKPGALLLDAGEAAAANGWVSKNRLRLPVEDDAYYWLGFVMQNDNTVRYQSKQADNSHYRVDLSSWSTPRTFPTRGVKVNNTPYVMRATVTADQSGPVITTLSDKEIKRGDRYVGLPTTPSSIRQANSCSDNPSTER